MNIKQQAIKLIEEIEKRDHTPSKVMGSGAFEQELMDEKIELVKDFYKSIIDMVVTNINNQPITYDKNFSIEHNLVAGGAIISFKQQLINSLKQD